MGDPATAEVAVLADVLKLVEERAPKLRAAGVLHLRVDGFDLDLAPLEPEPPDLGDKDDDEIEEPADPLEDGTTYGLAEAPGFEALRKRRRKKES